MNTFVLYNGKNLDRYTWVLFSKWNFYKFRISDNFILPRIMSLIGRGGFFVGIPNPTKKIPIPGILNPMGFLPKSVGSQSREFPGIFENPRDFGNSQKIPKMKKIQKCPKK